MDFLGIDEKRSLLQNSRVSGGDKRDEIVDCR
jgi:hypothetical protein